jgi:hypothetical protein
MVKTFVADDAKVWLVVYLICIENDRGRRGDNITYDLTANPQAKTKRSDLL